MFPEQTVTGENAEDTRQRSTPWWPTSRAARVALIAAVWLAANLLLLHVVERREVHRLAREYEIPVEVIDRFETREISVPMVSGKQGIVLSYRYRRPARGAERHSLPLLVFLHGSGERGFDNVQPLSSVPAVMSQPSMTGAYPCALLVPQCPEGFDWSGAVAGETDMLDVVLLMIDEALRDDRIDPQRVYLAGFSMGASGAWDLAARAPGKFAAVVPIAGGGRPETAPRLVDVRLWAVHGAADEVVPVVQSRNMIKTVRSSGGNPRYTEYAGLGHQSWRQVFQRDAEVLEWIFQQPTAPPTTDTTAN